MGEKMNKWLSLVCVTMMILSLVNVTFAEGYKSNVRTYAQNNNIADYTIQFSQDIPSDGIVRTILFYSEDILYKDGIQNLKRPFIVKNGYPTDEKNRERLTAEKADKLIAENRALLLSGSISAGESIQFGRSQLTVEGKAFGKSVYYAYIATIDRDGNVEIYDTCEYIITADLPQAKTDVIRNGNGVAYPIGGDTVKVNYDYIGKELKVGLSSGERPKIALINSSRDYATSLTYAYDTEDDPEWGNYEQIFGNSGMEIMWIPLNYDTLYYYKDSPYTTYYAELIKSCDGVYLMGGDQMLHAKCLLNEDGSDNAFMEAIRYVYNRGGFIAGTSAGLHIMSDPIYSIGKNYGTMHMNLPGQWGNISTFNENGETDSWVSGNNLYTHGIGLIPKGYLLDSHFDARGRLGRLIVALRDQVDGIKVGIGADESTGLRVEEVNGQFVGTVVGLRGVYFVDATNATYSEPTIEIINKINNFSVEGIRVDYLTAGDTYNFETKEITISKDKKNATEKDSQPYTSADIFREYETTKALHALAESTLSSVKGYNRKYDEANNFEVTFEKGDKFIAKTSDLTYGDTYILKGYHLASILDVDVSVKPISQAELSKNDYGVPVVHGIRHYSKAYSAWVWIDDIQSGVDPATVNSNTVKLISEKSTLYKAPQYSGAPDDEIEVTIDQDSFETGDQIVLDGIKDLTGNKLTPQTWEKQGGGEWKRVK